MKHIVLYCLLALTAVILFRGTSPNYQPEGFNIEGYAALPAQVYGRITPLDTVARNSLLSISKRQTVELPSGERISAIEWLMALIMKPEEADTYRVFKIEFPDELGLTGLAERGQRYYSFNDLVPHFGEIRRRFDNVSPEPQLQSPIDKQFVALHNGLQLYHRLLHSFHPVAGGGERLDKLIDEYMTYRTVVPAGIQAMRNQSAGQEYDSAALNALATFGEGYLSLSETAYLRVVPPAPPATVMDNWQTVGLSLMNVMHGEAIDPFTMGYATLTTSFRLGDTEMFNQTVDDLNARFATVFPDQAGKVGFEYAFNTFAPFDKAIALYILIFLVVLISWIRWPEKLGRAAYWLLLIAFILHTAGLLARMYISGRPPVTNLYSSAVFVGWGATLLGLVLERFFRNGVGAAMAAMIGICTLIIANHLAVDGDTLELMRAVLDSNFWLATHVIIITKGYSAMFLAGALGMLFAIRAVFVPSFDKAEVRFLSGAVYGITCFAVLFNLVGTILGGIWADQSWGRFWGWDPKENGALMIVIMGAILLHARWGGIARERGIMAIAIAGNVVTAWSWFGTNLLGVGLHSYGFTEGGFYWLSVFAISQVCFIALLYVPQQFWLSKFGASEARRVRKQKVAKLPAEKPDPSA